MIRLAGVCVFVVAVMVAACSPATNRVTMEARRFRPATVTVEAGETVVFANTSREAHTVTAYDDEVPEGVYFSSGGLGSERDARANLAEALIESGDSYEVTFERPGTYGYFCIPHEDAGMKGTVIVEP